jgi:hypothetical protein
MVDSSGRLLIVASKNSSSRDFEFLTGKWKMQHRRLNQRLEGCKEWTQFESWDENYGAILNGIGNTDIYYTTSMPGMQGKPFQGFTLRLFDEKTRLWSLYWVANNVGVLDPPVVGSFEGNTGRFYCKDIFWGKPVLVMFNWDKTDPDNPVWSQAFSADNGKTWEWNWYNTSHRVNVIPEMQTLSAAHKTTAMKMNKTNVSTKETVMETFTFNSDGSLNIRPAARSSQHDFDFYIGKWKIHNRKLKERLNNNNEWTEFEAHGEMHTILNGIGNTDNFIATIDGKPFEGMTLRLFNPKTRLWSIYWADSNTGVLDPPVVGSFENNIGVFYTKDIFKEKPVIVKFVWDKTDLNKPVWSQAFSEDNGKTWEWNWYMYQSRFD